MSKTPRLFVLLAGLIFVIAACTPGASSSPSTPASQPPTSEEPMTSDEPSTEPSAAALSGTLTIWHAYGSSGGNAEFNAFTQILEQVEAANPDLDLTSNLLEVPFGEMFSKFETEVAAGGGPDLLIAPNDSLGTEVRGNFLVDLTGKIDDVLAQSSEIAVAGSTIDGKVYEIPESVKAVAMYYNGANVPEPPTTTEELLAFQQGGGKVGMIADGYFTWGWYNAFGGDIFDADGKCAATATTGVADAMAFVKSMKDAGAVVDSAYDPVNTAFKNGDVDIIFNGNWVLGDYKATFPELGVSKLPTGPDGDEGGTMVGVDGYYVNAAGQNIDLAIEAAKQLVSPEAQQIYVDVAGHAPANTTVDVSDPLVTAFTESFAVGEPRPQIQELNNYWGNFGNAWNEVLTNNGDPTAAVATACTTMDTANNK
jgi:arabinogalactan oligomer / maltooligosaccharide transport system substrate-binding protein